MSLSLLRFPESPLLRWVLMFLTTFSACLGLASMMIGSAALRDHYTGVATLTPVGFINVCALMPITVLTVIINLMGLVGAFLHNHILLLVYSGTTFISLVVHFAADSLGMMHMLTFEGHTVNSTKALESTGVIRYKDSLDDLQRIMNEAKPSLDKHSKDWDFEDGKLRSMLHQYLNSSDWRGPRRHYEQRSLTPDALAEPKKMLGRPRKHHAVIQQRAAISSNITDESSAEGGDVEDQFQSLVPVNGTYMAASQMGNMSADTNANRSALLLQQLPLQLDWRLAEEQNRAEGRLLIRQMELQFQKALRQLGTVQRRFKCCGSKGYRDYLRQNTTVPSWCCRRPSCDHSLLRDITLKTEPLVAAKIIYIEGCGTVIHSLSRYINGILSFMQMFVVISHIAGCVIALGLATVLHPRFLLPWYKLYTADKTGPDDDTGEGGQIAAETDDSEARQVLTQENDEPVAEADGNETRGAFTGGKDPSMSGVDNNVNRDSPTEEKEQPMSGVDDNGNRHSPTDEKDQPISEVDNRNRDSPTGERGQLMDGLNQNISQDAPTEQLGQPTAVVEDDERFDGSPDVKRTE